MKIIVQREKAALKRIRIAINLRGFTEDNKRQKLITSTSISNSPLRVRTSSTDSSMKYCLTMQELREKRDLGVK
jgi:hypothetical protein